MTRREMTVDEKCYELADAWLSDRTFKTEGGRKVITMSLAQAIQRAIEDWCEEQDEERDEVYERAAARARLNDFADTGGKDWM